MNRRFVAWSGVGAVTLGAVGGWARMLSLPPGTKVTDAPSISKDETDATLKALKPPKRQRPLIAIVTGCAQPISSQCNSNIREQTGARSTRMVHEMIDGTYRQTNLPNESKEYLTTREALRHAEIELMKQRERVAELRRALPKGATIPDYEFLEGPAVLDGGDEPVRRVRMSELFTASDRSLVIYHFMFGKKQTRPCPMCTSWIDSFNGIAHHLAQNVDVAIVAAADPPTLRAHARKRGWDKVRLLSAGNNTFKYDLGSEDREGRQDSTLSVFTRDSDGTLRHFYSVHPRLAPDIQERGIDEYNPIWNILDLTPHGRGNWSASLDYGTKVQAPRRETVSQL